ncbi:transcription-repair coupling factor [Ruminococcaceae bacterium OttesenSCG-928-D13]|nr:transcription-repair coupling factor [Ruminococcaceae bacterium OttesenSCG-928-D13]
MLTAAIKSTAEYRRLLAAFEGAGATALFGLPPSARAAVLCALCEDTARPALVITPGEAEATRFAADAETLGIPSAVYPARDFVMRNIEGQSREYEYRRLDVLGKLVGGRVKLVAAPIEAVLQRTLPKSDFLAGTLTLKPGQNLPQQKLVETLHTAGYFRRSQVDGPGQFSVRGGIVDIYPPDRPTPARIEYWGDEIDSIHAFDLVSQRREAKLSKIYLSPAREVLFGDPAETAAFLRAALNEAKKGDKAKLEAVTKADLDALDAGVMPEGMDRYLNLRYPAAASMLDYMDGPILFFDEPSGIRDEAKGVAFRSDEEQKTLLEEGLLGPGMFGFYEEFPGLQSRAEREHTVYAENFARGIPDVKLKETVSLQAHAIPPWPGDVATLTEELRPLLAERYFCVVLAGTAKGASALARDLENAGIRALAPSKNADYKPVPNSVVVLQGRLSAGAQYPSARFAIFTSRRHDAELTKKKKSKSKGLSSLSNIKAGDYVVHQSHGIGLYAGIQRLDLHGVVKDYLKISYDKGDTLYVPVTQLDLLSRYTAPGDEEKVKLSRLGGEQWAKTKARVKRATTEMAQDLIELYAKRRGAPGFSFPTDTEWQRDFEARFEFEETDDQLTSARQIKKDMERPHPMDRLLAGDVGVGKTEVALRAAFKCVMGGKQCAILVPTTILAWQHYNTILSRMEAFPVKAEMLSRFRTPKQIKEAVKGLNTGTVDIVVGTHRLLQSDIKFHDLGLLIVDEEQRFGVRHKEKLKETFIGVDTLTLSATPIPRTLNMALSGIRDMSTIEEPPTERQPVETYVMEYDDEIIASAIKKELARAGQVYYIHNRIETIDYTAQKLHKLLPNARIAIAHGRMAEEELSRTWQQLLDGEVDILVCTTLIETGIDVRNVNTLVIEDADRMGLAQLYQIRGRVGRSGRKAYAYFTFRRDKVLTDVAAKRLSAIREFTAFGSGFRIAMRDLQIRGAGNLLGQSQSGHMEAVGYDLYVKMLNQAVAAAKGEAPTPDKAESLIDITVDAYIPDSYIPDAPGRIEAYKRIAAIESEAGATDVLEELADRYGPVVDAARGLVDISLLRVICARLGIYEVTQQKDTLILYSDALQPAMLKPLMREKGLNVMFNASSKPYLAVRLAAGQRPLDALNTAVKALVEGKEAAGEPTGAPPA